MKLIAKILLLLLVFCSCNWQRGEKIPDKPVFEDFQFKEPLTFQANLVLTTFYGEGARERTVLIAKDGSRRFIRFGDKAWLQLDKKLFLIDYRRKTFVEMGDIDEDQAFLTEGIDPISKMMTSEFLNKRYDSEIKKLSTENGVTKYLVTLENSSKSEIILYYDEDKKIITEQEFFSVKEDGKKLLFKAEFKNWSAEVSEESFRLPEGFKRADLKDF
jgi:hypothetical protein